jgi:uncharacterized protein (TIGR03084 family)
VNVDELCDDLGAERAVTAALLTDLGPEGWRTPTPAPGWSVRDQVTHLAWFDEAARQSIAEPDAFRSHRSDVLADVEGFVEGVRAANQDRPGPDLLAWLHETGAALTGAARRADPTVRVPWYGPDMTVASSITARIMETWAHSQDIADALGVTREPSPRLHHVAFIGCRALPNSFIANGRPVPEQPVRVELGAWTFGPEEAADAIRGSLLDFCLVVTQRRHPADTDLVATGPVATEWLTIAQAFAGPPGPGRQPGQLG